MIGACPDRGDPAHRMGGARIQQPFSGWPVY
jgi:hypothetical protein